MVKPGDARHHGQCVYPTRPGSQDILKHTVAVESDFEHPRKEKKGEKKKNMEKHIFLKRKENIEKN